MPVAIYEQMPYWLKCTCHLFCVTVHFRYKAVLHSIVLCCCRFPIITGCFFTCIASCLCWTVLIHYWSCDCAFVRMIQQAFIDMENMFDLMKEKQEVSDVLVDTFGIVIC